jgi:hypothetical protein
MDDKRPLFLGILASIVFLFASATRAKAGCFPSRPAGGKLTTFTGVLTDYSIGNDVGVLVLTVGSKEMQFDLDGHIYMNGKEVLCKYAGIDDPEFKADPDCPDWPSWLVPGKTVVTATCWLTTECSDCGQGMGIPCSGHTWSVAEMEWACDEIDSQDFRHVVGHRSHP